jgi:hypothetical protein
LKGYFEDDNTVKPLTHLKDVLDEITAFEKINQDKTHNIG